MVFKVLSNPALFIFQVSSVSVPLLLQKPQPMPASFCAPDASLCLLLIPWGTLTPRSPNPALLEGFKLSFISQVCHDDLRAPQGCPFTVL